MLPAAHGVILSTSLYLVIRRATSVRARAHTLTHTYVHAHAHTTITTTSTSDDTNTITITCNNKNDNDDDSSNNTTAPHYRLYHFCTIKKTTSLSFFHFSPHTLLGPTYQELQDVLDNNGVAATVKNAAVGGTLAGL